MAWSGYLYAHPDASKYACELLGTYFLVLTVGLNTLASGFQYGAPLSVGCVLMVMIFSMGSVSGGHFNPAVTLAVYLAGAGRKRFGLTSNTAVYYVIFQLVGAFLAGLTYFFLLNNSHTPQPMGKYSWKAALAVELLYTALLCFVVLNVACTERHRGDQFFGLTIGFTVVAAAIAVGSISGCYLNPAVSFGTMVTSAIHVGGHQFRYFPLYFAVPFFGSALGWLMFYATRKGTEYAS